MKIMRQELYDKVVLQYAESIGDETFHVCLERLQQWEKHPPPVKSNCTAILRSIHSFSNSVIRTVKIYHIRVHNICSL